MQSRHESIGERCSPLRCDRFGVHSDKPSHLARVYEARQPERLIYANRMACTIWGCESFEELNTFTGGVFKGMVHPDDFENTEQEIWSQIENGNGDLDQVKYRIIRRDGTISRVDDFGRLIRDEVNGDVFYVFVAEHTGEDR